MAREIMYAVVVEYENGAPETHYYLTEKKPEVDKETNGESVNIRMNVNGETIIFEKVIRFEMRKM